MYIYIFFFSLPWFVVAAAVTLLENLSAIRVTSVSLIQQKLFFI